MELLTLAITGIASTTLGTAIGYVMLRRTVAAVAVRTRQSRNRR